MNWIQLGSAFVTTTPSAHEIRVCTARPSTRSAASTSTSVHSTVLGARPVVNHQTNTAGTKRDIDVMCSASFMKGEFYSFENHSGSAGGRGEGQGSVRGGVCFANDCDKLVCATVGVARLSEGMSGRSGPSAKDLSKTFRIERITCFVNERGRIRTRPRYMRL